MRTVQIEVLTDGGWETVVFEDIEALRIGGCPGDEGIQFTLIGERPDGANQIEAGILDIAKRHRSLVDSDVPTVDETSLPVFERKNV